MLVARPSKAYLFFHETKEFAGVGLPDVLMSERECDTPHPKEVGFQLRSRKISASTRTASAWEV